MRKSFSTVLGLALLVVLALAGGLPSAAVAQGNGDDHGVLQRYARDTWASFVAMTDPDSGRPADSLSIDGTRSVQTSTTNIGAYMWSTLVAEQVGLIGHS